MQGDTEKEQQFRAWSEQIPMAREKVIDSNHWVWTLSTWNKINSVEEGDRAQYLARLYPGKFRVLRHEDPTFEGKPHLCIGTTDVEWSKESDLFVKYGESVVLDPLPPVIGYTHSDGYCLCIQHGTEIRWSRKEKKYVRTEIKDAGNETGHVFPIFENAETDTDFICDTCHSEEMAKGDQGDVRNAIILEANIKVRGFRSELDAAFDEEDEWEEPEDDEEDEWEEPEDDEE